MKRIMRGSGVMGNALVALAMTLQGSPLAWAQLVEVDPVLHAGVEALVTSDPEIARDPEFAQLCRSIAEAVVLDPRERAAVTQEAAVLEREGIDLNTVISPEVRETARARFNEVQTRMQAEAETLRASDPERAKGIDLMIREGERQMTALEQGERYTPSTEMVAHAQDMFRDWESGMLVQGAPPEFVEAARNEFTRWSSGEMNMMGGPGQGPGSHPGEAMGPGGMFEQMTTQGILTPEQLQAARDMMQQGTQAGQFAAEGQFLEQMVANGQMSPEQLEAARDFFRQGSEHFGPGPGGFEHYGPVGGWEGGSTSAYMPEGWAHDQSGNLHYVGSEGTTYTSGWESTYSGGYTGDTWTQTSEGTWTSSTGETWTHTGTETWTSSNSTELRQDLQTNTTTASQERYETAIHLHEGNTEHQHTVHVHSDGVRHDHTATSPADTAPNSVFQ